MIDDGGQAYPQHLLWTANSGVVTSSEVGEGGMSLRDYFAAAALQGLLANNGGPIQANGMSAWGLANCSVDTVAGLSYDFADAMLRARGKK